MKSTEDLIEEYQTALEEQTIAEDTDDESESEKWSIIAADLARELKGRIIRTDVRFPNGKKLSLDGKVHSIRGDEVYFESTLGDVVGDANCMESAE